MKTTKVILCSECFDNLGKAILAIIPQQDCSNCGRKCLGYLTVKRAVRKEQERGWRPIESAPKDGTKILAWCPHPRITNDDAFFHCEIIWWRPYKANPWRTARNDSIPDDPTHWQPLPDPPKGDAE